MTTQVSSSWISSVCYLKGADGRRFLIFFRRDEDSALLYADVPEWLPGLVCAGKGGKSVGSAYNKLVKGKYPYQRVNAEEVKKLIRGGKSR